jgi:hypothetical protein
MAKRNALREPSLRERRVHRCVHAGREAMLD